MRQQITRLIGPLVAAIAVAGGGATPARSDEAPTAMIVLDGSGSMWGRLPPANHSKIDLVRQKLGELLATPFSTRLGLVSFGHRRRGDCGDVELIAGPDSSRQEVLDPIAKLNPRGPGPLTAGLKVAMDAIGQSRPAQIVVVGDNADNCQQDSCALAQEFAKMAPGVAVHVIGIGVPANERPRMACIAEATGGHYYDISDSNGLDAALDEATKLAILSPGAVAATNPENGKPAAPRPPEGASLRASAALRDGGPLLTAPLAWRIHKAGEPAVLAENTGADISAKLPAGNYDIEAQLGAVKARQTITIADGDAQSIIVPLDAAHLAARVAASKGGPPSVGAVVTLTSHDAPVSVARGGSLDLYLSPAEYNLTAIDGAAHAVQTLQLAAGDDKALTIDLSAGRLNVAATKADGSAVQDVLYTVEADDPESPNGRRDVAQSRDPHAGFTLPEGTYYLTARSGGGSVNKRVAIGAGQTVSETLSLALVPVTISALVAGEPAKADQNIFYRVERIDGDRAGIARSLGPTLALELSPGSYRISASLAASHLSASQDIAIAPGKPATPVIDIASGQIDFAPPQGAKPVIGEIYWEVADQDGMAIWRATGTSATAILAPGRYTVRFDARDSHGKAGFEVRARQKQKIEIGPG